MPKAEIENFEDLSKFVTYYYRMPNPELESSAIAVMQQAGFPQKDEQTPSFVGFFSGDSRPRTASSLDLFYPSSAARFVRTRARLAGAVVSNGCRLPIFRKTYNRTT